MNANAPFVHPCCARPPQSAATTAAIVASIVLLVIGAMPGPFVWLVNLTAVPLMAVALLEARLLTHVRTAVYAAWGAALLHVLLWG